MSNTEAATSPAAQQSGDGSKSGNISLTEATQKLLHKMEAFHKEQLGENAAGDVTPPEGGPPGQSTPAVETTSVVSRETESQASGESAATPDAPEAGDPADIPTDLSQLSNLDPKTRALVEELLSQQKTSIQAAVNKRIGKEVARTKALEEQLAKTGTATTQAPAQNGLIPGVVAPAQAPTLPAQPAALQNVFDVNGLNAVRQEAMRYEQEADDQLVRGPNDEGKFIIDGVELTKDQVLNVRRNARAKLNVEIPQRYNFLVQRNSALQNAYAEFPWLSDQSSPEYQQAMSIIRANPELAKYPNVEYVVAAQVEGLKVIEAKRKAKAEPAKAQPPASKTKPPSDQTAFGGGASAAARTTSTASESKAISDEIGKLRNKGGVSFREAAAILARKDQLSRTR